VPWERAQALLNCETKESLVLRGRGRALPLSFLFAGKMESKELMVMWGRARQVQGADNSVVGVSLASVERDSMASAPAPS